MIEILLSPNEPHTLKYLKINLRHFCVTERLEDNNGRCESFFDLREAVLGGALYMRKNAPFDISDNLVYRSDK